MQHRFQNMAVRVCLISASAAGWLLILGPGVADAATRFRSGSVRSHLLGLTTRVAPNGTASSGLHLTGPDVMASFVAVMAILAFLFIVVTFIRRRIHTPRLTSSAA